MTASIHFQATDRKAIDIGDGLIMRWSTSADAANVASLVAKAFTVRIGLDVEPSQLLPRHRLHRLWSVHIHFASP